MDTFDLDPRAKLDSLDFLTEYVSPAGCSLGVSGVSQRSGRPAGAQVTHPSIPSPLSLPPTEKSGK